MERVVARAAALLPAARSSGAGRSRARGAEEYDAVEADPRRARAARSARARRGATTPRSSLDELRNAIALVRGAHAPTAAPRLDVGGALAAVPATARAELADALRPVIGEHERLWLARNRPGGLRDSRAWLEHLLGCYETGETDFTWNGVHP